MAKQTNSLAHTKWMCKYHIVFTPKYRRKIVYNQYKSDLRDILKQLCSYKGVEILEGHLMPDHVHMLVSIPPKISVSSFMGYLKGKKFLDDLWSSCKPEVQIWESAFLVSRLLCQYGRSGYTRNNSVYSESTGGRSGDGTINVQRVYRPVYG